MALQIVAAERAWSFARQHWKAILGAFVAVAVIATVGYHIVSLHLQNARLETTVAERDKTIADMEKLEAEAISAVIAERNRILIELSRVQSEADAYQRQAMEAARQTNQKRSSRLAETVAKDPTADRPVGTVLGSIFEEEAH